MKIGILSGIGAAADSYFYHSLIKEYQRRGARKDSDFPEVVLYNFPFNGTDKKGISVMKDFKADLKKGIDKLNLCGVDIIVMVCNTAHLYFSEIQNYSKATIMNMIEITKKECGHYICGIICSRTSKKKNLYSFVKFYPTEKQQQKVDNAILHAISGEVTKEDRINIVEIMLSLIKRGANKIILGCTELPLVFLQQREFDPFLYDSIPLKIGYILDKIIDPGSCLIKEIMKGSNL